MFTIFALIASALFLFNPKTANAHCDTLDGPVICTARQSLQKGDVTPVLKWVKKEHAEERIVAGRKFVETYVEFVHYVQGLHELAAGKSSGHAHDKMPYEDSH